MSKLSNISIAPLVYVAIQIALVYLSVQINPQLIDGYSVISLLFLISLIITNIAFFTVHLKDPGYLPRDGMRLSDQSSRIDDNHNLKQSHLQRNNDLKIKNNRISSDQDKIPQNINNPQQLSSYMNRLAESSDVSRKPSKEGEDESQEEVQCEPSQGPENPPQSPQQSALNQSNKGSQKTGTDQYVFQSPKNQDQESEDIVRIDVPNIRQAKESKALLFSSGQKSNRKSIQSSVSTQNFHDDASTKATTAKTSEQITTTTQNYYFPQPSVAIVPCSPSDDPNSTYFLSSASRSPNFLQQLQSGSLSAHLFQQQNNNNRSFKSIDIQLQQAQSQFQQMDQSAIDCSGIEYPGDGTKHDGSTQILPSNINITSRDAFSPSNLGLTGLHSFNRHRSTFDMQNSTKITHNNINQSDSVNDLKRPENNNKNFSQSQKFQEKDLQQMNNSLRLQEELRADVNLLLNNEISFFKFKQSKKIDDLKQSQDKSSSPSFSADVMPPCEYIELRHCMECNIEQKMRSKHCKICRRCVACYDHHCPWIGNCVGERNKCMFWWFLLAQTVTLIFTLAIMIMSLATDDNPEYPIWIPFLDILILVGFLIMVSSLLLYHSYLATENITTWENAKWESITYLKDWPENLGSPFSRGCWKNLKNYCRFMGTARTPLTTYYIPKLMLQEKQEEPSVQVVCQNQQQPIVVDQ